MADEKPSPFERAKEAAVRLLRVRSRSRSELIAALERKGFDGAVAARVADELARLGYMNERLLADETARGVTRRGPAGRALLEHKMESRRVEPGAAERAIDHTLAGRDPVDDATTFIRQRLAGAAHDAPHDAPHDTSHNASSDPRGVARRLLAALARRGFDEEVSLEALRRVMPDALDEDRGPGDGA